MQETKRKNTQQGSCTKTVGAVSGICLFHGTRALSVAVLCHEGRSSTPSAEHCGSFADIVAEHEERVRHNDDLARTTLRRMIPCGFLHEWCGVDLCCMPELDVSLCPDIDSEIIMATLPAKAREDTFVAFLRGSIPVLNNYKKIHRDIRWPQEHAASLARLLRVCTATLLSLFPSRQCKDVTFGLRVRFFGELRALLLGTHEARATFITEHKSIVRLCLVEYAMFCMRDMPMLSRVPNARHPLHVTHFRAAQNMGQHFRVELNSMYSRAGDMPRDALWKNATARAQVLYDRYVRVCKSCERLSRVVNPLHDVRKSDAHPQTTQRVALHRAFKDYGALFSRMPIMGSFNIAEMYMRRSGIPLEYISLLWDCRNCLRIYPLPASVMQSQYKALFRMFNGNQTLMHNRSHLLVCTFCLTQNVTTSFRYDSINNVHICNRCEVQTATVDIDLIGRILYVKGIPLVFCSRCCEIVVWSGTGVELTCADRSVNTCHISCQKLHILWKEDMNLSTVDNVVQNCSFSQFIMRHIDKIPEPRPFLRLNPDLSVQEVLSAPNTSCSLCRTSNIFSKNVLLDVKTCSLVTIQTCYRHSLEKQLERFALHTMHDFVRLHQQTPK